jgi:probable phosphoglycerate mutase
MRRRLYLLRHAEVSYAGELNPETVMLTEEGREQARAARRALEGVEFDLLVTSGLPRTVETAALIAPGREPERWAEFDEWRGGRLDGLERDELERLFVGALHVREESQRFLGGESLGEAFDRILPAFERLLARDWDTALAVFHGGVNRILLSHALAGGRVYFSAFEQAPACINVLDLGSDGAWVVRTINYVPYDPLHPARTTTMEHLWVELQTWLDEARPDVKRG